MNYVKNLAIYIDRLKNILNLERDIGLKILNDVAKIEQKVDRLDKIEQKVDRLDEIEQKVDRLGANIQNLEINIKIVLPTLIKSFGIILIIITVCISIILLMILILI